MAEVGKVEGLAECLANFNIYEKGIENATPEALAKGALILQAASQEETPVDKGFLKGSSFTRPIGLKEYHIGFTQSYSIFVHEMTHLNHPVGNAKFLTGPMVTKDKEILQAIKNHLKTVRVK